MEIESMIGISGSILIDNINKNRSSSFNNIFIWLFDFVTQNSWISKT